ncbi:efflux RND transporter periplasmic adaptor subunit [Ekhidna sp. To15]|uniref:efflux RND transporter periplasmic adaptor subunit n=1 Tax=Ekhidna sp. To15 TaxID=3395267 RepID=UPI003F51E3B1
MKKLISIYIVVTLLGCSEKPEQINQEKQPQTAVIPSSLLDKPISSEVGEGNVLSIQGIVDVPPNQRVSIQPYFEGYISDLRILEGSKVNKGDLLFKLVNPAFIALQEDYLMDKATVAYLEKVFSRAKTLHDERVTADQDFEEMQMNYQISKANLEAVSKRLRMMNIPLDKVTPDRLFESINIYAPISGYVDRLLVNTGEFIEQGSEVTTLVNTDHVHLELRVFEKDLKNIREGQLIMFRVPEISATQYESEVFLIGKSIDAQTRMIQVHAHVEHPELELLPGMFVEAEIELTK